MIHFAGLPYYFFSVWDPLLLLCITDTDIAKTNIQTKQIFKNK